MDLQTLFYIVSIAFMLSVMVVMIGLGYGAWMVKKKLDALPVVAKTALAGFAITQRGKILSTIGMTAGAAVLAKLKDRFIDKKR